MQVRFRIVTSCLGLVLELLATTACTSYSNSLSESVWFLESQLQDEWHRSAVLRQEAEGLRKFLEHSDAYFLVQQQALEDFSAKQDKANQLSKLIVSMVDTQDNISWALLKLFQLCSCFAAAFICTGGNKLSKLISFVLFGAKILQRLLLHQKVCIWMLQGLP